MCVCVAYDYTTLNIMYTGTHYCTVMTTFLRQHSATCKNTHFISHQKCYSTWQWGDNNLYQATGQGRDLLGGPGKTLLQGPDRQMDWRTDRISPPCMFYRPSCLDIINIKQQNHEYYTYQTFPHRQSYSVKNQCFLAKAVLAKCHSLETELQHYNPREQICFATWYLWEILLIW